MRDFTAYLEDILKECIYLSERFENLSFAEFISNEDLKRAAVRSLEVIGEASKKIPEEVKERYPSVPWREMARMRDKLIHGYFSVDYLVVYRTVLEEISPLKEEIEKILRELLP